MHPLSGFSALQVLWTLSFAGLMVLLVVLLGKDRYRSYKLFTIAMVLLAFRLLLSKLLFGRIPAIPFYEFFIPLTVLASLLSVAVLVEMARRAFLGAGRRAWLIAMLVVFAIGAAVLVEWGPWPAWKTLSASSTVAILGLGQMASQKIDLLTNVLAVELGLLVLFFGRRFHAPWRSHTQGIVIGLSTAAIGQLLRDGVWQLIAMKAAPRSQEEFNHLIGIRENLAKANELLFLLVLIWWIAVLWIDEPGALPGAGPGDHAHQPALPVEPVPALQASAHAEQPIEFEPE